MTFPTSPALPYTSNVSTITAATLNTERAQWPKALDAVGGGTYTNLAPIVFDAGSAGWEHRAALTVSATGTFHTVAGGTCTLDANTTVNGAARFNTACLIDNGGHFELNGGCTAAFASGSTTSISGAFQWIAGSSLSMQGASFTMGNDTTASINGSSGHVAAWTFGQYSTITRSGGSSDTFGNGSNLLVQSNAVVQIGAGAFVDLTIGGGGNAGTFTLGVNGTASFAGSSTTTYAASSVLNNGAIEHRTGPTTRNGNDAYEGKRLPVTPAEGITSLDPWKYCVVLIPALTADREWWLQPPPGNTPMVVRFKRTVGTGGNGFALTLRDQNTSAFVAKWYATGASAFNQNGWCEAFYTGAAWTALAWGGVIGSASGDPF